MKQNKKQFLLWLERANDDLLWTKANIKEKIYYGACFTSQQAIEKALKAYILYKKGRFGKIHDLVKLLDECSLLEQKYKKFRKKVALVSYYYIHTRYPDISEIDKYDLKDADEAYEIAEEIVRLTTNIISSNPLK